MNVAYPWTSATVNTSYNGAVATYNPVSYWADPFGIVHIRGVLIGAVNVAVSTFQSVNIANGFPLPANNSRWNCVSANNTGATVTYCVTGVQMFPNGAMQIAGSTMGTGAGSNVFFISLDGLSYSING